MWLEKMYIAVDTTTGDGIISALQILRILKTTGQPLSELKRCLTKYPQAQRNLKVKEKRL